ncbi:DUF4350 domain-containing protein [Luteimonas sp. M1R5S18]|uniref:DUF4350 domain-containing protein n=1 Tax=Luteimonas rhizosphaericola TaxID=3042024 RepID=A0ABT6JLR6_9GAMM|nr:DUF4350 domain-containing protein [Luteimonas rhizosphaericola]MDH5831031.1 DUF4350 domain-containing protein [Luteimonas rhizosphaericola]
MNGWAPRVALVALGLLCAGAFAAWWLHSYERVEHRLPLPPAGEAAYNPLYALRLALRADGVEATSRQRLDLDAHPPGPRDTVLLLGDPGTLAPREVEALLAWVDGGGHLLVSTPRGRRMAAAPASGLLTRLGIELRAAGGCERMHLPGQEQHVEFCGGTRFIPRGVDPELAWGDFAAGFVFARLRRGEGAVDVLAAHDFVVNGALDEAPHAALTRQLLDRNYGRGTIHLVYAASMPGLWRLLLERAWMAWAPLLLALAAWLWMRLQRIGPVLPSPPEQRRSLLEHVQASGEHLRRYGRAALLHAAVREAFLDRLRRRDPLAAALDGPARVAAIAARTGLAAADIEHALREPRPRDGNDFRQRVARLIDMRRRL